MWPFPHRIVGNLILVFADRNIYSTRPRVQSAALCVVSRDSKLRRLSHRQFNLATIQYVLFLSSLILTDTVRRGGTHRNRKGDNREHP